jgi:hypothetical protein
MRVLDPASLADWEPSGAVWYAHACCSAGTDSSTVYGGLFDDGSSNDLLVKGLTSVGACVAPLPKLLLGMRRPLRAFVGHVEPTFDWTLKHPASDASMSDGIVEALYNRLYVGEPLGMALKSWHQLVWGLYLSHQGARAQYDAGADNLDDLLYLQLAARDIQSTVILGDPAAALVERA